MGYDMAGGRALRLDTMDQSANIRRRGRAGIARACGRAIEALESRLLLAANDPYINEFLANNDSGILDDYNDPTTRPDWIELYNPSTSAVSLTNWHLTDRKDNPNKWTFPAGASIPAQGYLLVFASGRPTAVGPQ